MRPAFVFYPDRCIGCGACQTACKTACHLGAGEFFRRVGTWETFEEGRPGLLRYSGACGHCVDPACVRNCPSGAMYIAEDGTVQHDEGICMACGCCSETCPYGAPVISFRRGTALKCDMCAKLRAAGREPACAAACLTGALETVMTDGEKLRFVQDPDCFAGYLSPRKETIPAVIIRSGLEPVGNSL